MIVTIDELAALLPYLDEALFKDNTAAGRHTHVQAGLPVNTDVLSALVILHREIPAATMHTAELIHEPWQPRSLGICLLALERFTGRLRDLGMRAEAEAAEDDIRRWTRTTKLALGLREPDEILRLYGTPVRCPADRCAARPLLRRAGRERFLQWADGCLTPGDWVEQGRIYCPGCAAAWPATEWRHLGRLLRTENTCDN